MSGNGNALTILDNQTIQCKHVNNLNSLSRFFKDNCYMDIWLNRLTGGNLEITRSVVWYKPCKMESPLA